MIPRLVVVLASCVALVVPDVAAAPPLIVPSDAVPVAVAALGPLEQAQAFGVSEDGSVAVAAFPSLRAGARSVLRIGRSEGETAPLELSGEALALVVSASGNDAFVVVRETDKKGAVRRTGLFRLDPRSGRLERPVALPVTARGVAFAPGEAALIVAAKDELRTFTLPGLTSGPMYRVAGENAAVAPVAGTTHLLVGRGAEIILVDLAGPQGREGLPSIETATAAGPVRVLSSAPGAPSAIAWLEGGQAVMVETGPLRVAPPRPATVVAWPGAKALPAPVDLPVVAVAASASIVAAQPESPPPVEPPPVTPPAQEPAPSPAEAEKIEDAEGVRGQVTGSARAEAYEIIFLGPNNVLKEAARVRPDASGNYTVTGLPSGSYRVVAVGDGGRVLACRPPFVTVEIGGPTRQAVPVLEVVRSY